jgi:glycosyltransferase involved in cell wall biosynthesis
MMNAQAKTVSVVMCTYNGARYIRQQLDSIVNQTYPVSELIIQDDLSTDDTAAIVGEYSQKYPYIQFYENARRLGFNLNFKTAAMRATGDFVALSDQDDIWMPQKIEKQVDAIGDHDLCFSTHLRGADLEHTHVVSPQYNLGDLLFEGFAGHTMLLKRTFIQQEQVWIDHIYYDWSLALNAKLGNGITRVEEPLNWHRSHPDSAAQSQHAKFYPKEKAHPFMRPYLHGFTSYRRLQQKPAWKAFYTFIYTHTTDASEDGVHTMSRLMLSRNLFSLLRLCLICLERRKAIYPSKKGCQGIAGLVRGFFFPFIFAYHNTSFDLE